MALRKCVINYEVIYNDEECNLDCLSLSDIDYLTTDGPASGRFLDSDETILTNEEAYKALEEQGSDPEFMALHKCSKCQKIVVGFENFDEEDELCKDCSH